jgi:hypothetical protein
MLHLAGGTVPSVDDRGIFSATRGVYRLLQHSVYLIQIDITEQR